MNHEVRPISLHSREGLALLSAIAVVLLIAFFSYRSWAAFGRDADQQEVTRRILTGIIAVRASLTDAETGQRGFLLTGQDRYLDSYRQARADMPVVFQALGTATMARPDQAERIRSLIPLVDEKLDELARTIELRGSQGPEAAFGVVDDHRRMVTNEIREICSEIQTAATERLAQFLKQARSWKRRFADLYPRWCDSLLVVAGRNHHHSKGG